MTDQIQGWGLIGALRSISKIWGKGSATKLVEKTEGESQKLLNHHLQSTTWLPTHVATDVLKHVEQEYGDGNGEALKKLGYETGRLAIDVVFTIYQAVGEVERALKSLPNAFRKIHSNIDKEASSISSRSEGSVFSVGVRSQDPEVWTPFWEGWIRGYLEAAMADRHDIIVKAQITEGGMDFYITHPGKTN